MRTGCVRVHSRGHADSECVLYVRVDRNGVEFVGNKHTHWQIHSLTHIRTFNFIVQINQEKYRALKLITTNEILLTVTRSPTVLVAERFLCIGLNNGSDESHSPTDIQRMKYSLEWCYYPVDEPHKRAYMIVRHKCRNCRSDALLL